MPGKRSSSMESATFPTNPVAPMMKTFRPLKVSVGDNLIVSAREFQARSFSHKSTHVADGDNRLMQHRYLSGAAHVAACHRDGFGQIVGALPAHGGGDVRVLGSGGDDAADVCAAVLGPVPHVEGVRAVIGGAAPLHLDVRG